MQRDRRLRRRGDFRAVYRAARPAGGKLLTLRAAANGLDRTRFGFVVAKTVGGAVERNRVRRRLREAARSLAFAPGFDVIVTARPAALSASLTTLRHELMALCARTRILGDGGQPPPRDRIRKPASGS
jgi:ribonuclease P protein component